MQNISDKADSTAGATGELTASEYNNHKNELQGTVDTTAQTLSAATLLQLSKALFINGAGASAVQDGGSGDSIILSPVTGASGLVAPDSYAHFDGGLLLFNKTTANTTTAVTVNFGQTGTELGAKSLVRLDGTVPLAGDIDGLCLIQWDNGADKWVILSNGSDTFGYAISSAVTVDPKFKKNTITVDTSGGGLLVPIGDGLFFGQEFELICDGVGHITSTFTGQKSVAATEISDGFSLKGKWDGVKWVVVNEVTADYDISGVRVTQSSIGIMTLETLDTSSIITTTTASGSIFNNSSNVVFNFPISFSIKPAVAPIPIAEWLGDNVWPVPRSYSASQFNVRLNGSNNSGTGYLGYKATGLY